MSAIKRNKNTSLVIADVDQTIAADFLPASPGMIDELRLFLEGDRSIFLVTGGPFNRVKSRITDSLPKHLRHRVVVAHCSGSEVWGFDKSGAQHKEPFYSLYDSLVDTAHKRRWREIVEELISVFKIQPCPVTTVEEFRIANGNNPLAMMVEDRGPQITLEMINSYDMNEFQQAIVHEKLPWIKEEKDLREPIARWLDEQFERESLPIDARFGGTWALDLAIKGVSKTEAVKRIMGSKHVIEHIGMGKVDLTDPDRLEIWGDRFDRELGTDWLMCVPLDPSVRAIDFRREDPSRFPPGYNIVIWDGDHEFQDGALEYLRSGY